jgi:hypothetical protein
LKDKGLLTPLTDKTGTVGVSLHQTDTKNIEAIAGLNRGGTALLCFNAVFPVFKTKGFADLYRRGTIPIVYAGCAHLSPNFGPTLVRPYPPGLVQETSARVHSLRGKSFTLLVPAVRPLANIGNASRKMHKDSELFVRGDFDLG